MSFISQKLYFYIQNKKQFLQYPGNILSEIRAILSSLETIVPKSEDSVELYNIATLVTDLEIQAELNDLQGFSGTLLLTTQTLEKLTSENSDGGFFWQLMSQILAEMSAIERNLLNSGATLFDVTYKFQHIKNILLSALKAKYGQYF